MSDSRGTLPPTDDELANANRSAEEALKHGALSVNARTRLSALNAAVLKQAEERANAEKAAKSTNAPAPRKDSTSSQAASSSAAVAAQTQEFSSIETDEEPILTNTASASSSNAPQTTAPIPSLIIDIDADDLENDNELDPDEPTLNASSKTPAPDATATTSKAWASATKPATATSSAPAPSSASSSATATSTTTPVTVSIQADMEPSLENENNQDTNNDNDNNDNNSEPEPSNLANENATDDIDPYELSGDEKRHIEKNFDSYQKRVEYFVSLARQRADSARAREAYETNQAINFTKTLQRKINALLQDSTISQELRTKANDLLYGCREILSLMENPTLKQTNILSYGSIPPQVFASFDEALKSIQGAEDPDPKKSTKGFFSTINKTSLVDSISTSTSEKPYKTVASPKADAYTACYYDIPTTSGTAKAASIQYEDPNTQEFRADLLFDKTTLSAFKEGGKEFNNTGTKYIPNADIMNWARGVISTFIADSRGAGELKLNCPTMPVICMRALVLHAKTQGIQISRFSNFSGLMRLDDITDKHVKLYEKQIEKHRDQTQLKDVSQFSVNEITKLEKKTNPNDLPLSERLKAGWHKFNKGWRNKDHHAHDPRARPAKYLPKVDVPKTTVEEVKAEETKPETKNKP